MSSTHTPAQETKDMVRRKYAEIAKSDKETNQSACCGSGPCSTEVYNIMSDDYGQLSGYQSDADLGMGCGLPTQFAGIQPGHTVVDLGSGAGNDCFVARHEAGPDGRVIGIDFTPEMIEKARANAQKLGFQNVEFRLGDIERIPMTANMADVVVSNCVLNLVPDKAKAFAEMFRILKPGGHFSVSDIVLTNELPPAIQSAAEMYAGCVSGAMHRQDYLDTIIQAGFDQVSVQKAKPIVVPNDILAQYLSPDEIVTYHKTGSPIESITVRGSKPAGTCSPNSGCCE
jgi:SAM-dependent methyltransferase